MGLGLGLVPGQQINRMFVLDTLETEVLLHYNYVPESHQAGVKCYNFLDGQYVFKIVTLGAYSETS